MAHASVAVSQPTNVLHAAGQLDYCFLSPIYDSISKAGYASAFSDQEHLRSCLATSRYPVLALGGVQPQHLPELADLVFSGAALLGWVWQSEDPIEAFALAAKTCQHL